MGKVQTQAIPSDDVESAELDEDEQKQADEQAELQRQARLDSFAGALASKRKRAVEARAASGIEQQWRQDEEFYEGIDNANRAEKEGETLKPVNQTGGASINSVEAPEGSTIFLNITRPYVDFSAGRAADMLLPTSEPNWGMGPTPMPDIVKEQDNPKVLDPDKGITIGQAAKMMIKEIADKAAAAEKRIKDWHEECQFNAEERKILKDGAKVGVGILKGPIPTKKVVRAVVKNETTGSYEMKVLKETAPVSKRIDYWKFFPDPACGENIHNGSYIWECDDITARQLRDLMGTTMPGKDGEPQPMYIESSIQQILEEGPQKRFEGDRNYTAPDSEIFQIWYFYGVADAEDLRAAGVDAKPGATVPVLVTMVNDRVIKAALTSLDSGDFPYDVFVWQQISGHWAGIGVGRQVREPQRILNAGVRNMMDNAGLAAGPQIVYRDGVVKPVDKVFSMRPRKFWKMDADSAVDDVRKAFAAIDIPMMQAELMAIIQFALKMAEDITGLPMLMQGQQGTATTTVGGMTLLQNNSNTPMRTIAKLFDDLITEPHVRRYYEWLLQYGPSDDEKGDFKILARGSTALFERDAQHQAILQMGPLVKDPAFGIDPKKWIKEALKAQRLLPENFQYTEDELKEIEQKMAENPPVDPKLESAKIAAQARVETAKIAAAVQDKRIEKDTDRDTVYVQAEMQRAQAAAEATNKKLAQELQITLAKFAEDRKITLEEAKVELSKVAMQLQTQKELAGLNAHGPQVAKPPTEPPGRANDGQAYQA